MEDALISTVGLAILTGADVIDASDVAPIIQHVTERIEVGAKGAITLSKEPYQKGDEHLIYVMVLDDSGNPATEPYIYKAGEANKKSIVPATFAIDGKTTYKHDANAPEQGDVVLVDYYVSRKSGAQQIEITADKFGGNFYLEASTLFRDTNGRDMPAEFVIPNCKVQSNFTFTMASSGDPSTFTFTMDAFPDYTRFNKTKKVISAIQIITEEEGEEEIRVNTDAQPSSTNDKENIIVPDEEE
jgi:hypothetical protein